MQIEAKQRVQSNNRQSNKIAWYRRNALDMVRSIDAHLENNLSIYLPENYNEYKQKRAQIFSYDLYEKDLETEIEQLVKLRYDLLKSGRGIYALFPQDGAAIKSQLLCCWYSKHRFDPVWNYRKSQLIRRKYKEYLSENKLHETHHACHLVLTVPHPEGKYNNKTFYINDIVKAYNELRKTDAWKKIIHGGEYGVEVKKSRAGGYHIHIHSLVFQHKHYSVNTVRKKIYYEWNKITGAEQIHYETLYFYKKDPDTKKTIKEYKVLFNKQTGEKERTLVAKKYYIDRYDAPDDPEEKLKEYLSGVMECIKYHFKNDTLEKIDEDGKVIKRIYDVPLMIELLNNTKNVRLYSRFGALYKVPELNFNNLVKDTPENEEEEISASTDNVIQNLINPHTGEPAVEGEYYIAISKPELIKHYNKNSVTPNEPIIYNMENFYRVRSGLSLKEIVRDMVTGYFYKIIDYDDYQRYLRHFNYPTKQKRFKFYNPN